MRREARYFNLLRCRFRPRPAPRGNRPLRRRTLPRAKACLVPRARAATRNGRFLATGSFLDHEPGRAQPAKLPLLQTATPSARRGRMPSPRARNARASRRRHTPRPPQSPPSGIRAWPRGPSIARQPAGPTCRPTLPSPRNSPTSSSPCRSFSGAQMHEARRFPGLRASRGILRWRCGVTRSFSRRRSCPYRTACRRPAKRRSRTAVGRRIDE